MMFIHFIDVNFIHFIHLFHFMLFHLVSSYSYTFLDIDVIALLLNLFTSTDVIVHVFHLFVWNRCYTEIFKFSLCVSCWNVVVSDGTGGLISMVWNSFF